MTAGSDLGSLLERKVLMLMVSPPKTPEGRSGTGWVLSAMSHDSTCDGSTSSSDFGGPAGRDAEAGAPMIARAKVNWPMRIRSPDFTETVPVIVLPLSWVPLRLPRSRRVTPESLRANSAC